MENCVPSHGSGYQAGGQGSEPLCGRLRRPTHEGVTTILFLRRSSAPGTPYVTLEMDGNQIRQIHGYHNDTLPGSTKPQEVHRVFLDTWLRWLRAGSQRNEDGTPKLPRGKRRSNEAQARTA